MIDRMERVQKLLKRKISVILQSEINDPRVKHVTILKVEVSRDLREARVFCEIAVGEDEKKAILKGLKSASGFIRGELANSIELKFIPRLTFLEDRSEERKETMDKLFEKIEKEHNWESTDQIEGQDE